MLARELSSDPLPALQPYLLSNNREALTALRPGIDHFKRVNDGLGRAVGDEVLTRLAACLTARIGEEDLPGRLGGEDPARALPGTEPLRRTARGLACSVRRWMVGKIPKSEVAGVRSVSVADL